MKDLDNLQEKKITGCHDCPFFDDRGYLCTISEEFVKASDANLKPFHPDWCPLKKQSVIVQLKT